MRNGELSDVAPTILALLGLDGPSADDRRKSRTNPVNISVYTAATLSLPQPDFGVLRKAQRGDERAFSIIVRAYQIPVFNYVLRMVGDRSLAEDLTQEVFLRVFQGLPRFSLRSKFTTWLFQVTKNRVLDELRAIERRPRAVVDLDDIPPLEVIDAPFERLEAIDAVWRAVERLNVDLKMALLLRDIVGLSYTRDRRLARGHARHGQVADLQGARRRPARARPRGDRGLRGARGPGGRRRSPVVASPPVLVPVPVRAPPAAAGGLETQRQPRREHLGQPRLPHLALRALDVVLDAAEARAAARRGRAGGRPRAGRRPAAGRPSRD